MSISVCITGLIAEGRIRQGSAQEAEKLYGQHLNALKHRMSPMAAAAEASERTIKSLDAELARRKGLALRSIETQIRIEADLKGFNGGAGGDGPIDPKALPALLDKDMRASYSNVEGRRAAIRGDAHRTMSRILTDHSANLIGQMRNAAQMGDIVAELFGKDSGNIAAREMADGWRQAAEMLRQRFNAAGGDIGKLYNWGLPQSHDWQRIRAAGYDAWKADILPRLDRAKMIDRNTGAAFTDDALDTALEETWERIRTNGWSDRTPGTVGKPSLANSRDDSRFLIFKSPEDWMGYQERFGSGSPYDAMMRHIDDMARDVAMMEILGPNPQATLNWAKGRIEQSAALDKSPGSKAIEKARQAGKLADNLFDEITGKLTDPRSEKLALTFSSIRSLQTGAKLGGAFLSGVSDFAFGATTRVFNGLPVASMFRDYAKLMLPGDGDLQAFAIRRGLIAEEYASRTAGQSRYIGEELTGEIPRRLAAGVLRLSLLSRHTQSLRWANGIETLATFTEQAGKSLDELRNLEPRLVASLERYGIDSAKWDALRSAPMEMDRGANWLTPSNSKDRDAADKFMEMIHTEVDFAVPTADLRTRAMFNSAFERGTLLGEIGRSALLFKSFGVSVLLRQGHRIQQMAGAHRLRYAGGLIASTTIAGGLAIMLKDVAAGRDPRAADNPEFWGQAVLQGGGFGIFGDLVKSQENRLGGGFASAAFGPMAQTIDNFVMRPLSAKEGRADWSLAKAIKAELPGQSLWYTRLAFDRLIADQLQESIDPDYAKAWRRMDKWADEQGTSYFWDQGEITPDRAPDFSNIAGGDGGDDADAALAALEGDAVQ